jgi:hypothetical protein
MVPRKQGLIVTVSSMSGIVYSGNVSHGIGKVAVSSTFFPALIFKIDFV